MKAQAEPKKENVPEDWTDLGWFETLSYKRNESNSKIKIEVVEKTFRDLANFTSLLDFDSDVINAKFLVFRSLDEFNQEEKDRLFEIEKLKPKKLRLKIKNRYYENTIYITKDKIWIDGGVLSFKFETEPKKTN